MSQVSVDAIIPQSGTTITIGGSGDTVTLGSGASASGFTSGIVGVSTFTSSGTWTKATREAALGVTIKRVIVEVQGAGGAGTSQGSSTSNNSPGGCGAWCMKLIDVSGISSATITVGSGGTVVANSATGNAGGASSWVDGTNTLTANGANQALVLGSGVNANATASGGDINLDGRQGSFYTSGPDGKDSRWGWGGIGDPGNLLLGSQTVDPVGYGAGGGTSWRNPTTGFVGPGADGIVIVTEIAG